MRANACRGHQWETAFCPPCRTQRENSGHQTCWVTSTIIHRASVLVTLTWFWEGLCEHKCISHQPETWGLQCQGCQIPSSVTQPQWGGHQVLGEQHRTSRFIYRQLDTKTRKPCSLGTQETLTPRTTDQLHKAFTPEYRFTSLNIHCKSSKIKTVSNSFTNCIRF